MNRDFQLSLMINSGGTYLQNNYSFNMTGYGSLDLSLLTKNFNDLLQKAGVLAENQSLVLQDSTNDQESGSRGSDNREIGNGEQGTQEGSAETSENSQETEQGLQEVN